MRCIAIIILCFTTSLAIGGVTIDDGYQRLTSESNGVNVKHLCESGIKKPSKETIDAFKKKSIHYDKTTSSTELRSYYESICTDS